MAERIPQSTAIRVPLEAYLAADHITPATGKTIAITISKNGGAYANPSAGATNAVEIGNGSYYVDLSTTDINTFGPLKVRGIEATIDAIKVDYDVVSAASGGLSNLDATMTSRAATGAAMTLTSGERDATADALLNRDMATGTDTGSSTVRTVRQALRALRNKWTNSGGTYTVYKEDDGATSWTAAVSTDATAVPIVGNDPAGP